MKTYLHVLNYCYLQVNQKQVLPSHQPLQQAQLPHQPWFGIQVQLARRYLSGYCGRILYSQDSRKVEPCD